VSQDPENLKKTIKEHSEKLAKLGMDLGKNQFRYKIEKKASKEYWQCRIEDFKKYNEKGLQYYSQVYAIMNLISKEESHMFLLRTSKFQQMSKKMIELMEKIRENPSIIDPKDRQQSKWSKEIKNQLSKHSDKCLQYEIDTNTIFREFYEKHLKKMLE
jgi:hypothetical protein